MSDIVSKDAMLHLLRQKYLGTNRTLSSAALRLKVSAPYLSRVFLGDQPPSQNLLDTIGIVKTRETIYRRKEWITEP